MANNFDDMTRALQELGQAIDGSQMTNAWTYAAERTLQWLKSEVPARGIQQAYWQWDGQLTTLFIQDYLFYQNYGVAGVESSRGAVEDPFAGRTYKYGSLRPPAGVFGAYADTPSGRFAIATKIYKYGIPPKNWFNAPELEQKYVDFINEYLQRYTD